MMQQADAIVSEALGEPHGVVRCSCPLGLVEAAPALAASCAGGDVAALSDLPTLATTDQMGEITWAFSGPDGAQRTVRHEPRLTCVDFRALRDAAVAGLGVALLPEHTCRSEL